MCRLLCKSACVQQPVMCIPPFLFLLLFSSFQKKGSFACKYVAQKHLRPVPEVVLVTRFFQQLDLCEHICSFTPAFLCELVLSKHNPDAHKDA